MLDERYAQSVTKVHAPAYVRPKGRTGRMVLAELFTGAGCPPCVGADLAFDGARTRRGTSRCSSITCTSRARIP